MVKDMPMGSKDAVLPKLLPESQKKNYLLFEKNIKQPYMDNFSFSRAPALHLLGIEKLEEETSESFNFLMDRIDGLIPSQLQSPQMNNFPFFEDLLLLKILLYDFDIVNGKEIGEFARGSVQKYKTTVRLLRHNDDICYMSITNAFSQYFR